MHLHAFIKKRLLPSVQVDHVRKLLTVRFRRKSVDIGEVNSFWSFTCGDTFEEKKHLISESKTVLPNSNAKLALLIIRDPNGFVHRVLRVDLRRSRVGSTWFRIQFRVCVVRKFKFEGFRRKIEVVCRELEAVVGG